MWNQPIHIEWTYIKLNWKIKLDKKTKLKSFKINLFINNIKKKIRAFNIIFYILKKLIHLATKRFILEFVCIQGRTKSELWTALIIHPIKRDILLFPQFILSTHL